MHTPATQCWPAVHADPAPQWQTPFMQLSAPMPQAMHAAPPVPQADADGVVHVVPWQQPLGHDVPLHTHAPPEQRWPAPHAGPGPHWQAPLTQESAIVALQATQAEPPVPQADTEGVVHIVPWQQPFGHDVPSHAHVPPKQRWPAPHAGPVPHLQTPLTQAFAPMPQFTHAAPPVPQAEKVGVSQVEPEQQPFGHELASHTQTPPTQRCPGLHTCPPPQTCATL